MANSINNWLGFSLSPQDHFPSQDHSQNSVFNSGTQVSSECFDLTSDSTIPSLNLPAPFVILQDFQRNHSQDRNVKDVGLNSFSCSSQNLENQEEPKLENFLGVSGHTSYDQEHNNTISTDTYIYQEAAEATSQTTSNNNSMGLSMIKNWLRNNPAPPQAAENKGGDEAALQPLSVQTWSLLMSTGTQSSSHLPVTVNGEISTCGNNEQQLKNDLDSQAGAIEAAPRKSIDTFGQRTSIYRGVTRHRWTGRYEAHLWDNSYRREGQARKGRQVYLGGYDQEEKAARSYDLAALKYWGTSITTNFPMRNYEKEIEEMKHMTRQEYVASLRRKSSGFSRGASIYRGVTRHHQHGRWQARIGRVSGNKDVYLGTFSTQEEAAEAYDIAAIKFRGLNAVTNFEISRYDVKSILESSTLQIGGAAKRLKDAEMALEIQMSVDENPSLHLTDGLNGYSAHHGWRAISFQQAQPLRMNTPYPYSHQRRDPDVNQSFRDLQQLQLGNAQNFLQHSVLHNLMSLDSSSVEHSSGSNSIIYSNNGAGDGNGTEGNFVAPMGNMIAQDEVKPLDNENMFGPGSWDPYLQERNFYYQSQQASSNGLVKAASVCDQASTCDNWIPTGVPNLAARPNNMAVCHGASTFTIWNQT